MGSNAPRSDWRELFKWGLSRASKGRIRSYLYFRRNHDRTKDV
nr:MAG TPA: hypothetical protein [Caudoviricetes sp.]